MRIHTTEMLGPKQSKTPDGFLLCKDVAIARTGDQRYAPTDGIPVEPGRDGMIRISRDPEEVFRDETIASFEGKPITVDHTFITPENYRQVVVGHVQNVRRGEGLDSDLLLADMLIQDADAIDLVRAPDGATPRREVSCGYDADYEQITPGHGRQKNIVGNHVALVERGRAGMRCSIQDEDVKPMKTTKQKLLDLVRGLATKDADIEKAVESMDERTDEEKERDEKEAKTADSIATLTKTVDSLAETVKALAGQMKTKDEESKEDKKTEDDADEEEAKKAKAAVGDAMSAAEILAPGFKTPTADSVKTMADITAIHRDVLTQVAKTTDGAALLKPFLKGRTIDAMSADAVAATIDAAAEVQRVKNNSAGFKAAAATQDRSNPNTPDAINARNIAYWNKTVN